MSSTLSLRSQRAQSPGLPYWGYFFEALQNLYHSQSNPSGVVCQVVAENALGASDVSSRLKEVSLEAFSTPGQMGYDDMRGRHGLRKVWGALAEKHITQGAPVASHNLVVGNGCGALVQHLAHLLMDTTDCMLLITPTYGMLYNDVGVTASVQVVDVPIAPGEPITTDALEEACARAAAKGLAPKVVFLIQPENPLGTVRSVDEIRGVMAWVKAKGMHLVSDEIYALSVYDGEPFVSTAQLCHASNPSSAAYLGDHVHILWGMSKDFCASGLRVGILFSHNEALLKALDNVGYFSTVSNPTQDTLALALGDDAWLTTFLQRNHGRLREARDIIIDTLTPLGVKFVVPRAGLFIWVDLSPWLPQPSTWEAERTMTKEMFEAGVLYTPGEATHASYPGCFRICFAWHAEMESVRVGMERLKAFLGSKVKHNM